MCVCDMPGMSMSASHVICVSATVVWVRPVSLILQLWIPVPNTLSIIMVCDSFRPFRFACDMTVMSVSVLHVMSASVDVSATVV